MKKKPTKKVKSRRRRTQASWSYDSNQEDVAEQLTSALHPLGIEVRIKWPADDWDTSYCFTFRESEKDE